MMRAVLLSVPWFVLAILAFLRSDPVSREAFAALCAAMGATFILESRAERIACDTAYMTGVRHACEEARRSAQEAKTPAEALAVLDAAERAMKLMREVKS